MKCYIFDIDGTLADLTHRRHFIETKPKDWNAFKHFCFEDTPITHIIDLCRTLYWAGRADPPHYADDYEDYPHHEIVLMSGRNECQRTDTEWWLREVACLPPMKLYMRTDEDYRPEAPTSGGPGLHVVEAVQRRRHEAGLP